MAEDENLRQGFRKDGQPYKEGNTRPDGSYGIGKGRTAEHTRFSAGDGRPRGRRPKGTKNLLSDWQEELSEKIAVTENGKTRRHTKQRGIVKQLTSRALKGNDRAAEIALRHAGVDTARPKTLSMSYEQIFARWLQERTEEPSSGAAVDTVDDEAGSD